MPEMQSSDSKKAGLDSPLSKILFNYVIPFLNPNYIVKDEPRKMLTHFPSNKLYSIIYIPKKKDKLEISLLEEIILSKVDKKKVKVKKINNFDILNKKESIENKNNEKTNDKNINDKIKTIDYSLELIKENTEEKPYSVSITYEENSEEEKLDITIKSNNYSLNKLNKSIEKCPLKNYSIEKNPIKNNKKIKIKDINEKDVYSISITRKKENKSNYSVKIKYEDNYQQERLSITYKENILRYQKKREDSLQDFSERVPGKFVNVFPESLLGGILGFTYLGENFMGKREDMVGNQMVDIHESIHTDNEYETRCLTQWILSKEKPKYVK